MGVFKMVNEEKTIEWAYHILSKENLGDWKINFHQCPVDSCDGYTWFGSKTIDLSWPKNEPNLGLVLHEIAHAIIGSNQENYHDSEFAHEYMRLVNKWMKVRDIE